MRSYAKVSPRFWTGAIGLRLRGDPIAQTLALYLVTCEHSNLAGLYRLPVAYVCNDIGLPEDKIRGALGKLVEVGFCKYDEDTQRVWIIEHLRHELGGGHLKPKDNRGKALAGILADHEVSCLASEFRDRYDLQRDFDGASKPPRSQEQEQEQDQEHEQEQDAALPPGILPPALLDAHQKARAVCGLNGAPNSEWLGKIRADARYRDLDLVEQLLSFGEWWSDQPKPPKSYKHAIHSWLRKAIEFQKERKPKAPADRLRVGGEAASPERREKIPEDPEAHGIWKRILARLEAELDQHTFNTWLRPTWGAGFDDGELTVAVPNETFADWNEDNYREDAERVAGNGVQSVRFIYRVEDLTVAVQDEGAAHGEVLERA